MAAFSRVACVVCKRSQGLSVHLRSVALNAGHRGICKRNKKASCMSHMYVKEDTTKLLLGVPFAGVEILGRGQNLLLSAFDSLSCGFFSVSLLSF